MSFTTWAALLTQMQDAMAAGNDTVGSVSDGLMTITYRSHDEFMRKYQWVEGKAAEEAGTVSFRTYAKQGGRGD